jgi:hypothetical protein
MELRTRGVATHTAPGCFSQQDTAKTSYRILMSKAAIGGTISAGQVFTKIIGHGLVDGSPGLTKTFKGIRNLARSPLNCIYYKVLRTCNGRKVLVGGSKGFACGCLGNMRIRFSRAILEDTVTTHRSAEPPEHQQ